MTQMAPASSAQVNMETQTQSWASLIHTIRYIMGWMGWGALAGLRGWIGLYVLNQTTEAKNTS